MTRDRCPPATAIDLAGARAHRERPTDKLVVQHCLGDEASIHPIARVIHDRAGEDEAAGHDADERGKHCDRDQHLDQGEARILLYAREKTRSMRDSQLLLRRGLLIRPPQRASRAPPR